MAASASSFVANVTKENPLKMQAILNAKIFLIPLMLELYGIWQKGINQDTSMRITMLSFEAEFPHW